MFYRFRDAVTLVVAIFLGGLAAQLTGPTLTECLGIGTTPYESAPVDEKPIAGDALAIGLAEVLVEEHVRLESAELAFVQIRAEAQGIIGSLVKEIERLKSRPVLTPGMETAGEPAPADPTTNPDDPT